MSRCRAYCLTLFGDDVLPPTVLDPQLRFWCGQRELCPDTARLHLQFTVEFKTVKSLKQVRDFFPGAHVEVRLGSAASAIAYCTKEESRMPGALPVSLGDLPKGQGARSDLAALQVDLDAGTPTSEIASTHFATFLRYNRGITLYQSLRVTPRY